MSSRDRSANPATWSVIIGTLLGVVLFLGAAYSRQPLAGLILGIIIVAYLSVLMILGRINVFHVLWGGTVDEDDPFINRAIVVRATAGIALVAVLALVYDLLSSVSWGWFSWLGALIGIGYLASLMRRAGQDTGANK